MYTMRTQSMRIVLWAAGIKEQEKYKEWQLKCKEPFWREILCVRRKERNTLKVQTEINDGSWTFYPESRLSSEKSWHASLERVILISYDYWNEQIWENRILKDNDRTIDVRNKFAVLKQQRLSCVKGEMIPVVDTKVTGLWQFLKFYLCWGGYFIHMCFYKKFFWK